jgi:threonine dehydrogenase-like Zn-dependent dehydrogenase
LNIWRDAGRFWDHWPARQDRGFAVRHRVGRETFIDSCQVGQDWDDAIALLQYGRIKPQILFSKVVPVRGLEAALKELRSNRDYTKVFVSPDVAEEQVL